MFEATDHTVTIPQCIQKECGIIIILGGIARVGGVKVPSIRGPEVATNRGIYTCRIYSFHEVVAFF